MTNEEDVKVFRKYRVQMRTNSGMYAQYEGHVDVFSPSSDSDELFSRAVQQLRRTSYPDYSASMWVMTGFEEVAS